MDQPPPSVDACTRGSLDNWALNATVTMSSTDVNSTLKLGVNDNLNLTNCPATQTTANPLVRVDMNATRQVDKVFLLFPSDIAINRLEIYVGEDGGNNRAINHLCTSIQSVTNPWTVASCTQPMNGRYVFLRLQENATTIKICRIYIYSTCLTTSCSNVALSRPAYQSSLSSRGIASLAVDGNRNSNYFQRSCTHTKKKNDPWWYVDLQRLRVVQKVLVTNRKDCCVNRLNGMEVWIGIDNIPTFSNALNTRCGVIPTVGGGETVTVNCSANTVGQYVIIRIPGRNKTLTLCEVEVYEACTRQPRCVNSGCKRGKNANVALGRPTRQSSNFNSISVSANAVDVN
ncbi:uncharacterized protein LOC134198280 [Corticium candelabrum]|uniref:uncharacterized protein LOC134198280 n=1 Tax=Corticium candelabrum TaxID=121492 RepID=UPI002E27523D|nr:uncharacterized protein LOC134198280 [Corticium candelabrum]